MCLLTNNAEFAIYMMLLGGIVQTIASSTGCWVYMCEFVPEKHHNMINTIMWLFYASTSLQATVYFEFISKNYMWFVMIGFVGCCACTLGTIFTPESPIWLIKAGKKE